MVTDRQKLNIDLIEISGFPPSWAVRKKLGALLSGLRALRLINHKPVYLNVMGVSKNHIQKLNRRYRKKNKVTDVLSFEQPKGASPKGLRFLGDLVLCVPVVQAQAKQCRHAVATECVILLTHGLLHLLGYDHERSAKEDKKMTALEQRILKAYFGPKKAFSGLLHRTRSMK